MVANKLVSIGLLTALLGCSGVVAAQTFQGTVNGESRSWNVVSSGADSTVSIAPQGPGVQMVVIQGHQDKNFAVKGTLTINAPIQNGKAQAPDVMYFPAATMLPSYVSSSQQPGQFEIKLAPGADSTQVTGSYKGKLYRVDRVGQAPNMNDAIDVDVKFDVPARNLK